MKLPRGPQNGFDERTYLRRHGVHVVLQADRFRVVGRRGGLGGLADRLRERLARSAGGRLTGERRGLVEGVVLGDDQGLSASLRDDFRASGLYHLLAVSGQNVVLIVLGVLAVCWLAGIPRLFGELAALAAISAYVLAVGPQPSVIRAGVSGALGSLAWIAARERDRWHFLLLGALVLLAWNPYTLLDAGSSSRSRPSRRFSCSCRRSQRRLEGYPLPDSLRGPSRSRRPAVSRPRRCCGSSSTRSRCCPCPRTPPPRPRWARCSTWLSRRRPWRRSRARPRPRSRG